LSATIYDALGRVSGVSVPGDGAAGPATTFTYDGLDRVTSQTRPAAPGVPGTTTYMCLPIGGCIAVTLPPPPSVATAAYAIDAKRVRATFVNPVGNQTRQFTNAFGDVIRVDEMTGTTPTSTPTTRPVRSR
jgi:YD repeat-containing protein